MHFPEPMKVVAMRIIAEAGVLIVLLIQLYKALGGGWK
jgi:hypothetical protein